LEKVFGKENRKERKKKREKTPNPWKPASPAPPLTPRAAQLSLPSAQTATQLSSAQLAAQWPRHTRARPDSPSLLVWLTRGPRCSRRAPSFHPLTTRARVAAPCFSSPAQPEPSSMETSPQSRFARDFLAKSNRTSAKTPSLSPCFPISLILKP
jgi:hypothetical protein